MPSGIGQMQRGAIHRGIFLPSGSVAKSCAKLYGQSSGEAVHLAVGVTAVAAVGTVAAMSGMAVSAVAETVSTVIGRGGPSGGGRPSGEAVHLALASHQEGPSIWPWPWPLWLLWLLWLLWGL